MYNCPFCNRRNVSYILSGYLGFDWSAEKKCHVSLLQNSLGSGIYCREELLSLGARASRPHKTWQGRGDWLHRVGRFTCRLALEQRLDKYAGGTPALPGGNPWLARCRSLSRALFCRSILPPSHARLRILQKAHVYIAECSSCNRRSMHLSYDDILGDVIYLVSARKPRNSVNLNGECRLLSGEDSSYLVELRSY